MKFIQLTQIPPTIPNQHSMGSTTSTLYPNIEESFTFINDQPLITKIHSSTPLPIIKSFIEANPTTINQPDSNNNTPLTIACDKGNLDLVKLLISSNADLNIQNNSGSTPLLKACSFPHIEIIKLLLLSGADPNITDQSGTTPLIMLGSLKHTHEMLTILMLLIQYGNININAQNNDGWTGLMTFTKYAINDSSIKMIKLLLKNGADIGLVNKTGQTVQIIALCNGNRKIREKMIWIYNKAL